MLLEVSWLLENVVGISAKVLERVSNGVQTAFEDLKRPFDGVAKAAQHRKRLT